MQHRIALCLTIASILLGIAHIALTPLLYPHWTINALWFVGTGLAIVIGAAANIFALYPLGRATHSVVIVADVAMTGIFVAAWSVMPEPQVMVGGILFAGLAVSAFMRRTPQDMPNASYSTDACLRG